MLDTNACIAIMRGRDASTIRRLREIPAGQIAVCTVVRFELRYGAMRSANVSTNLSAQQQFLAQFGSLPLDEPAAQEAGALRAHLERLGTPIGAYDLLIAGIALSRGLTLVTANVREFSRVPGLRWENWQDPAPPSLHS